MKYTYLLLSAFILSIAYAQASPYPSGGDMHCTDYKWYRGSNAWYPIGSFDLEFSLTTEEGVLTYQYQQSNFQGYEHSSTYPRIPGPWKLDGKLYPSNSRDCYNHSVETFNNAVKGLRQLASCGGTFSLIISFVSADEIQMQARTGSVGGGQYARLYQTHCRSKLIPTETLSF